MGVAVSSRQIVHLHRPDEAELCLTLPVIQRLGEVLAESEQVRLAEGSDWIRLRLGGDNDVRLLVTLVSLAIKANARSGHQPSYRRYPPCQQSRQPLAYLTFRKLGHRPHAEPSTRC
jgi:hypothetical protein